MKSKQKITNEKLKQKHYLRRLNHSVVSRDFVERFAAVVDTWIVVRELVHQVAQELELGSPNALVYPFVGPSLMNRSDHNMPESSAVALHVFTNNR